MAALANAKHEQFCQHRAAGKSQEEAYKLAGYNPGKNAARQMAHRLATKAYIRNRIIELQAASSIKFEITVEAIAERLEADREFARKCKVPGAAVAATVALGKLGGLFVDRSTVNVTHNYAMMSEEELRFEIAALTAEARSLKPGVQH